MDEQERVKLEARFYALELMVCDLFKVAYAGMSAEQIHARHDQILEQVRRTGTSGLDPVESDWLSSELESAVRELLEAIETHAGRPRRGAADL